jgi:uncharacterized protein (DUF427 family)
MAHDAAIPRLEDLGPSPEAVRALRVPQRVRARRDGDRVADTTDALVLRPPGEIPAYWPQPGDVTGLALEDQGEDETDPWYGELTALGPPGGPTLAWRQAQPGDGPDLGDRVHLSWDRMRSRWLEDERIRGHALDPLKGGDVHPSPREVAVEAAGAEVARTTDPVLLVDTGLPTRRYFSPTDVDLSRLEAVDRRTRCPYKGEARHYDVVGPDGRVEAGAWTYPAPSLACQDIRGWIAFYDERVRTIVDGEEQAQPETPWS